MPKGRKVVDITGQIFGQYLVIGPVVETHKKGQHVSWHCRCACGVEKDVRGSSLRQGRITSCGHDHGPCGYQRYSSAEVSSLHSMYAHTKRSLCPLWRV